MQISDPAALAARLSIDGLFRIDADAQRFYCVASLRPRKPT